MSKEYEKQREPNTKTNSKVSVTWRTKKKTYLEKQRWENWWRATNYRDTWWEVNDQNKEEKDEGGLVQRLQK